VELTGVDGAEIVASGFLVLQIHGEQSLDKSARNVIELGSLLYGVDRVDPYSPILVKGQAIPSQFSIENKENTEIEILVLAPVELTQ
jgi:hypothetical protein